MIVDPTDRPEASRYLRILAALGGKAKLACLRDAVPVELEVSRPDVANADVKKTSFCGYRRTFDSKSKKKQIHRQSRRGTGCLSQRTGPINCLQRSGIRERYLLLTTSRATPAATATGKALKFR